MEIKLEEEVTERQILASSHGKLNRCLQDINSNVDEERKRSEQYI